MYCLKALETTHRILFYLLFLSFLKLHKNFLTSLGNVGRKRCACEAVEMCCVVPGLVVCSDSSWSRSAKPLLHSLHGSNPRNNNAFIKPDTSKPSTFFNASFHFLPYIIWPYFLLGFTLSYLVLCIFSC